MIVAAWRVQEWAAVIAPAIALLIGVITLYVNGERAGRWRRRELHARGMAFRHARPSRDRESRRVWMRALLNLSREQERASRLARRFPSDELRPSAGGRSTPMSLPIRRQESSTLAVIEFHALGTWRPRPAAASA